MTDTSDKALRSSKDEAIRLSNLRVLLHKVESAIKTNRDSGQTWVDRRDLQLLREFEKQLSTTPETSAPQAPIALLTINSAGEPAGFTVYAPGLPPGDHDVYLDPAAPGIPGNALKARTCDWPDTHVQPCDCSVGK